METPAWSKEELERIWATNWIPKVKSVELIAEQLMHYFFPTVSHRSLLIWVWRSSSICLRRRSR